LDCEFSLKIVVHGLSVNRFVIVFMVQDNYQYYQWSIVNFCCVQPRFCVPFLMSVFGLFHLVSIWFISSRQYFVYFILSILFCSFLNYRKYYTFLQYCYNVCIDKNQSMWYLDRIITCYGKSNHYNKSGSKTHLKVFADLHMN